MPSWSESLAARHTSLSVHRPAHLHCLRHEVCWTVCLLGTQGRATARADVYERLNPTGNRLQDALAPENTEYYLGLRRYAKHTHQLCGSGYLLQGLNLVNRTLVPVKSSKINSQYSPAPLLLGLRLSCCAMFPRPWRLQCLCGSASASGKGRAGAQMSRSAFLCSSSSSALALLLAPASTSVGKMNATQPQ